MIAVLFLFTRKEEFAILTIKDRNLRPIGVLENAYNISVERRVNALWTAKFSLPADDPKVALCSHLNFVEIIGPSGRYYGLYRIMPTETSRAIETNRISYELEHVLATLLDDVIDGLLPALINRTTRDNLQRLLNLQGVKHWRLGRVDFERFFQYSFENENGLLAPILSIPQPFDEPYEFTFDTQTYPWTLNLIKPSDDVKAEIRWGKDMISFDEVSDPTEIVNYLIPKGSGEGVNQLTISDVNGGKRYLKDDDSIAKWGKRSYIWIDQRFTHAGSLKESAQSLLNQWKDPTISFTVDSTDLSILPEYKGTERQLNGVTRIVVDDKVYYGRILEETIPDLAKEYDANYKISNKLDDIATIQADVERKQQVNEAYSQGATNILAFSYQDNADSKVPALIPFYVDDDVVNINICELTFRTKPYRAYSRATEGGGAIVKSTKGGGAIVDSTKGGGGIVKSTKGGGGTTESTTSGGATTESTTSGGGTTRSTTSGGGSQQTSSSGGGVSKSTESGGGVVSSTANGSPINYSTTTRTPVGGDTGSSHVHSVLIEGSMLAHKHSISIPAHSHSFSTPNHTHSVSIPSHSHDVTIPNHSHSVTIPSHSHNVTIPDHTHEIDLPNHTHEIELPDHTHEIELPDHTHDVKHEITELSSTPNSVTIRVDGNVVPNNSTSGDRINIVDYMDKDDNGKITRGRHEVTITPSGLARIEADLILRVFIQSQLGGVY